MGRSTRKVGSTIPHTETSEQIKRGNKWKDNICFSLLLPADTMLLIARPLLLQVEALTVMPSHMDGSYPQTMS